MSDLATLERKIDRLTKAVERLKQQRELLNEEEAAKFLGLTKKGFQNFFYADKIAPDMYKIWQSTARGCITKTNSHYETIHKRS